MTPSPIRRDDGSVIDLDELVGGASNRPEVQELLGGDYGFSRARAARLAKEILATPEEELKAREVELEKAYHERRIRELKAGGSTNDGHPLQGLDRGWADL